MDTLTNVPLFPLNTVLFPGMALPLRIFEERYKLMIGRCLEQDSEFGVVLIRTGAEVGGDAEPFAVGTLARIADAQRYSDGRYRLNALGTRRFRIESMRDDQEPYLIGDVQIVEDLDADSSAALEQAETVSALFGEYFKLSLTLAGQWQERVAIPGDPALLAHFVGARLVVPNELKQRMLEAGSTREELEIEVSILTEAIPLLTESVRQRDVRRWGSFSALN